MDRAEEDEKKATDSYEDPFFRRGDDVSVDDPILAKPDPVKFDDPILGTDKLTQQKNQKTTI